VIVAGRTVPDTFPQTLASLASQPPGSILEVLLADGSAGGQMAGAGERLPGGQRLALPGANLPALKGAAIRRARGELVAIIDPSDAAAPDWASEIARAFEDPSVTAAGGVVELAGSREAGNVAAYLFEYGAFNPPLVAGDTAGDLPGNNVAYRRSALVETCADLLEAEGFNKPFFHERLRQSGGRLVIWPGMRVQHLTSYRLAAFGARRFHYGRCFGAVRVRRAALLDRAKYRVGAPLVAPLLKG